MNDAHDFTKRLLELLHREQGALAEFLLAVADFDAKRLWVDLGYASLFDFLHRELRLSKGAAFYRKTAVGLVQRFPEVAEALRGGKLCLMTVAELARVLTPENRAEVLPRFFGLSKREAKVLAASLCPCADPPLRSVVTPVRAPSAPSLALMVPAAPLTERPAAAVQPVEPAALGVTAEQARPSPAPEPPATTLQPLTAALSRLHLTVTDRFLEKLEAVRAALAHSHPGASDAELLEAGLDLLLRRSEARKGLVKRPRKTPRPSADPEYVPAEVSRAVWKRDGGKCQWPVSSGGVCGSTDRAQLDHIIPRAAGGPSTVENCRILCIGHNDLAARQFFGDDLMDRYTTGMRARPPGGSAARRPRRVGRRRSSSPDARPRTPP